MTGHSLLVPREDARARATCRRPALCLRPALLRRWPRARRGGRRAQPRGQQSPTPTELQQIQEQIDQGKIEASELKQKADRLAKDVAQLQQQLVRSAAEVQDAESEATELEQELAELSAREQTNVADLDRKRAQLSQTLIALERLSLRPPQAAFLSDRTPIDEARAATLLAAATRALDDRARQLQSDLAEVQELREVAAARQEELAASVDRLAQENQHLASCSTRKPSCRKRPWRRARSRKSGSASWPTRRRASRNCSTGWRRRGPRKRRGNRPRTPRPPRRRPPRRKPSGKLSSESRRAEAADRPPKRAPMARRAGGGGPAHRPAGHAPAAAAGRPAGFPKQLGGLIQPARGEIAAKFGQKTDAFGEGKGLVIATRSGAQVVTPFDGQIVFEGPFRSYGQILIIEHRGGYHTVLAGLARVDAVVGQWLQAGEPVGAMDRHCARPPPAVCRTAPQRTAVRPGPLV